MASGPVIMRRPRDRIRHAVLFEVLALSIVVPLGGAVFGVASTDFGVIAVYSSLVAMGWNYAYNLVFDHALARLRGHVRKTPALRVLHAVLFEAGLLLLIVPFIMVWLDEGFWPALVMDLSLAGFYLVYALAFNWAYDVIFPLPDGQDQA